MDHIQINHCDIAPNNLLEANGQALLIDLDLAKESSTKESLSSKNNKPSPRTGHKAYMSIQELLAITSGGPQHQHSIRDDIESLFYCLLLEMTKEAPHDSLQKWSIRDAFSLLGIKEELAENPIKFSARFEVSTREFYKELKPAVIAWYEALFVDNLEGSSLVKCVRSILSEAKDELDDNGGTKNDSATENKRLKRQATHPR